MHVFNIELYIGRILKVIQGIFRIRGGSPFPVYHP